jgi:hypothetical protein
MITRWARWRGLAQAGTSPIRFATRAAAVFASVVASRVWRQHAQRPPIVFAVRPPWEAASAGDLGRQLGDASLGRGSAPRARACRQCAKDVAAGAGSPATTLWVPRAQRGTGRRTTMGCLRRSGAERELSFGTDGAIGASFFRRRRQLQLLRWAGTARTKLHGRMPWNRAAEHRFPPQP